MFVQIKHLDNINLTFGLANVNLTAKFNCGQFNSPSEHLAVNLTSEIKYPRSIDSLNFYCGQFDLFEIFWVDGHLKFIVSLQSHDD